MALYERVWRSHVLMYGLSDKCDTQTPRQIRQNQNTLWHWFRLPFWLYFRFDGIFVTSGKFMHASQWLQHDRSHASRDRCMQRFNDECNHISEFRRLCHGCLCLLKNFQHVNRQTSPNKNKTLTILTSLEIRTVLQTGATSESDEHQFGISIQHHLPSTISIMYYLANAKFGKTIDHITRDAKISQTTISSQKNALVDAFSSNQFWAYKKIHSINRGESTGGKRLKLSFFSFFFWFRSLVGHATGYFQFLSNLVFGLLVRIRKRNENSWRNLFQSWLKISIVLYLLGSISGKIIAHVRTLSTVQDEHKNGQLN